MGKSRYGWWGYVKDMIRRYPMLRAEYADLHTQSVTPAYSGAPGGSGGVRRTAEDVAIRELPSNKQREYEAVRRAVEATEQMNASRDRLQIINLVFWKRSHTLDGAAMTIPCSYRTARRYHAEFIALVAEMYGFLDS